jgi:hypothetical protein
VERAICGQVHCGFEGLTGSSEARQSGWRNQKEEPRQGGV